jgi:hypothetical protein
MAQPRQLREMIAAERSELVGFLRTLFADDWLVPSLLDIPTPRSVEETALRIAPATDDKLRCHVVDGP